MTPYFADQACAEQLLGVLQEWRGTPFMHRTAVRGVGVDCVHLVGEVMVATGVATSYDFGDYPLDWGLHNTRSLILEYLASTPPGFACISPEETPMAGDIACFRVGKCVQHCGIVSEAPVFWHALNHGRVGTARLDDPTWSNRLACFCRYYV